MKRDFLKGLNLENDVIDKIMEQYGTDVELLKAANAAQTKKISELESQLKNNNEQLAKSQNSTATIEDLQKQIQALQNESQQNMQKYQASLKQIKINNAVEKALATAKAKNNKVVLPLLADFLAKADLDENDTVKGLDEQIKLLAEAQDTKFLFDSGREKQLLKGVVPADHSENPVGFIDQAVFDANKNNPDWINKNWGTISVALKEGTIKK